MIASTPRVLEAIRRHKFTTLGVIAAELDLPLSRVAADLGGLHDYGYVTRYGATEVSQVSWVGPDDLYVRTCLEHAQACRSARQHDTSTIPPSNGDTRG